MDKTKATEPGATTDVAPEALPEDQESATTADKFANRDAASQPESSKGAGGAASKTADVQPAKPVTPERLNPTIATAPATKSLTK